MSLLARRLAVHSGDGNGGNGGGGTTEVFSPLTFEDSAWTWLHDPQIIHHSDTQTQTYVAWAGQTGRIWVGSWDHGNDRWDEFELADLGDKDDHTVTALGVRPDGKILACYSEHNGALRRKISTNAEDITAWGAESTIDAGSITYPNLIHLSSEGTSGRWYLFYRKNETTDNRPHYFRTSDDDGDTWSAETELFDVTTDDRPYVKIVSDGVDQIHLAATHGHPDEAATFAVYHFYYDAGTWRDSGGSDMGSPPFDETDVTTVSSTADEVFPYDIALRSGDPVILFATFPSQTDDHRYHHARWTGAAWDVNEFTSAGGRIAEGFPTGTWYSGGLSFDHASPDTVYLSREVATDRWEMEKWTTSDGGSTWSSEAITADSTDKHLRPVVPRGGGPFEVLWVHGPYDHFTDYSSQIVVHPGFTIGDYDAEVLADDPLFYYRFEETSGSSVDDETANNNDGTVSGADLNVSGQVGSAASFDGTDDYIEAIAIGDLAEVTVACWVKIAADVGSGVTTCLWGVVDDTSDDLIQLHVNSNGTLTLRERTDGGSGTPNSVSTVNAWDDGQWHYVVAVLDGSRDRKTIWVDTDPQGSSTLGATGTWTLATTSLIFGGRNVRGTQQDFVACDLDELAVYDRAVSGPEIYIHYTAGTS